MFRHVVMFRWAPTATAAQIDAVVDGLGALPAEVPSVRAYRFGPDAGLAEGNFDFTVVADFDDVDGYVVYRDHPDHRSLITELIAPIVAERVAVQYELD